MKFENILYEVKDGILYLTLNRPDVRNALSPEMWRDIQTAVQQAKTDDDVRVIIVSGNGGKALASGADIREIHDRDYLKMLEATASVSLKALEDLYKPVICAVNGYALGGGCELAMACDIRIATKRSKFGQPEVGLGIMPGAGGTQRLARLVGPGKAKELIFTGRIISAEEAASIGLVNQVTEDDPEALMKAAEDMARQIMSKGPMAVNLAKISINLGLETDINTGLMIERLAQTIAFSTQDRKEGTAAFLEKRPANFKGC
ncbi:enoyl-CoA hydratase-related protein [Flavonifractor sp. An100]|uniref:enoyl-CoA hydratase/isomerase family protein n=1 Tax=Flavonifractor sp. An100 TaxID=1965538 RepID=UPI000B3A4042|nr:enoyl-CoA hydratase-related protein [Flavonifractor sp. An100]OUQ77044.1 enoyl-CoA hydratase [Flavonifractor sp. An100]